MDVATMDETVAAIHQAVLDDKFTQHVVVNVAKLINMREDATLRNSVCSCDIINIDGMGVVFGARFLGYKAIQRIAGIDLFYELLKISETEKLPIYLLGAKESTLQSTVSNIKNSYPEIIISGYHHGYFWENEEAVVDAIKKSGAKLLFVAITSPKKENFINKWSTQLGVSFVMGVGGTFDVVSGEVKRAPIWMQNYGLEWFYRVIQEPKRMWKRYLITNTKFLALILREKIRLSLKR